MQHGVALLQAFIAINVGSLKCQSGMVCLKVGQLSSSRHKNCWGVPRKVRKIICYRLSKHGKHGNGTSSHWSLMVADFADFPIQNEGFPTFDSPKTHCFEQCRASRNPFWPVNTVAVRPENAKDRCGCSSWLF